MTKKKDSRRHRRWRWAPGRARPLGRWWSGRAVVRGRRADDGAKKICVHTKNKGAIRWVPRKIKRRGWGWCWGWPSEANWVWVGAVGRGCHCLPRRAWLLAGHPHMRPVTGGRAPPRWRPPVRYQIDPLVAAAPARCHDPRTIAWNLREREGRRWGIAIFRGAASFPPLNNKLTHARPLPHETDIEECYKKNNLKEKEDVTFSYVLLGKVSPIKLR